MTIIVTRDVPGRFRGFLSSVMLELAPGVYTSPSMNKGVRARVWEVMESWYYSLYQGSILMTWRDPESPSGQSVLTLGVPAKDLVEYEGLYLVRRNL